VGIPFSTDKTINDSKTGRSSAIEVKPLKPSSALPSGQFLHPKDVALGQSKMNEREWYVLL